MIRNNVFPLNSLEYDPNLRGEFPVAMQLVDVAGSLVAGVLAVDDIDSPFASADVFGAFVLDNNQTAADVFGAIVEAGSVSGIKVSVVSSDAASTTAITAKVMVVGRISPVNA